MNAKRENCYCGTELIRVSANSHDSKIPMGFYCPACKIQFGLNLVPLVSYRAVYILERDPTLGIIRDMFPQHWQNVIAKMLAEDKPLKDHKYPLDEHIKSLQSSFGAQVRQQEIKEAAKNQEIKD